MWQANVSAIAFKKGKMTINVRDVAPHLLYGVRTAKAHRRDGPKGSAPGLIGLDQAPVIPEMCNNLGSTEYLYRFLPTALTDYST